LVRPVITYGMFMLLVFVDVFGFYYAVHTGVAFDVALDKIWDSDTQLIWGSIVSFWFGSQAFSKK
jgi:ABC-type phosphate transport system permease subunit